MSTDIEKEQIQHYKDLFNEGKYIELGEDWCHEGLQIDHYEDGRVEVGVCSFSVILPDGKNIPTGIKQVADFIMQKLDEGWMGC